MKKIIITGAGGFVGLNLAKLIDSKKYNIIAMDKNSKNLEFLKEVNPGINLVNADLGKIDDSWSKYFKGADCVIQLQAQISSPNKEDYILNNIQSVKNLLSVCLKYKVKNLIHISTTGVISVVRDNYSITKTIGENEVRKSKIPYTILRPSMIYGCYETKHLGNLARMLDKIPLMPFPGSGKYLRQPIYVEDLCRVILKSLEIKPKNEIYNIIGKEKIYFIDMLRAILKIKKQRRILLKLPIPLFLLLLKIYGLITRKQTYQSSQLKALIAGDIFSFDNWEKKFQIQYTPFKEGVKQYNTLKHKEYLQKI